MSTTALSAVKSIGSRQPKKEQLATKHAKSTNRIEG
jgi:hypothetical protein